MGEMMTRTRAWRRWQRERIRRRRRHYDTVQWAWELGDPRQIGILSETPRPCSCLGCQHRLWWEARKGDLSQREARALRELATEANEECE